MLLCVVIVKPRDSPGLGGVGCCRLSLGATDHLLKTTSTWGRQAQAAVWCLCVVPQAPPHVTLFHRYRCVGDTLTVGDRACAACKVGGCARTHCASALKHVDCMRFVSPEFVVCVGTAAVAAAVHGTASTAARERKRLPPSRLCSQWGDHANERPTCMARATVHSPRAVWTCQGQPIHSAPVLHAVAP